LDNRRTRHIDQVGSRDLPPGQVRLRRQPSDRDCHGSASTILTLLLTMMPRAGAQVGGVKREVTLVTGTERIVDMELSVPPARPVVRPDPDLDDVRGQADRLWSHATYQDNNIIQRGNFFLVAESMILIAYAAVVSGGLGSTSAQLATALVASRLIGGFGLLLTAVWAYASYHLWRKLKILIEYAAEKLPEYRYVRDKRGDSRISPTALITYMVPALVAVMWIALLVMVR
jgi:hypothetical protein